MSTPVSFKYKERNNLVSLWVVANGRELNIWDVDPASISLSVETAIMRAFELGVKIQQESTALAILENQAVVPFDAKQFKNADTKSANLVDFANGMAKRNLKKRRNSIKRVRKYSL